MALVNKQFNEVVTFTRASGATRVNAAGLIVGVDFSSTSNTIGTGSKTFTLTADANVNRDWVVGSNVIAVSQAGATGSMTGTVTSYTASTQTLVINVTSITGSGTSTNWRIGSLDFRLDHDPITMAPRGGLVEGQATNSVSNISMSGNALLLDLIRRNNAGVAPNGSVQAVELETGRNDLGVTAGQIRDVGSIVGVEVPNAQSIFVKVINLVGGAGELRMGSSARLLEFFLNLATMTGSYRRSTATTVNQTDTPLIVQPYPGGWYRVSAPGLVNSVGGENRISFGANTGSIIQVWCPQVELGSTTVTSPIPTTTVAVTRAADLLNIDGTRFSSAYNQSQGTLYVEMTPLAGAVQAVAASLNDGTLNNAIRIGQKQSGTPSSIRAIASDGVTDVMAVNNATNNTVRSNGIDYAEVSDGGAVNLGVANAAVGAFLNVGGGENIRSSADGGLTYNARTIGGTLAGAHFGIGRFVIAASATTINGAVNGSVIVSTDGLSFRRVNIPGLTQNLNEITSNGTNQYVAVGQAGVIYTSTDAETWTAQTSGRAGSGNNYAGVTFGGGIYLACDTGANTTLNISRSVDGITWTQHNGNLLAVAFDVAYNGTNLFVVVGSAGKISSSPDGIIWTARTSNVTQSLNGVFFADNLWVAVGNAGTVVTSPDGITWTDRTATSGTTQTLNEVGFFGGKFYYVGNAQVIGENTASAIVAGTTWTARTANVISVLTGIATNGTRLLICSSSGAIATSEDGITFTSRTGNSATLNGAAFGAGTYVIAGNAVNGSGLIATVDPTDFTYQRRVSGTTQAFNNVRFLSGAFYAGGNANTVSRSADGQSWSTQTIAGGTINLRDIAFGAGIYVAVGEVNATIGRFVTSTDGLSWSVAANITGAQQLLGVDFANGLFVAVGAAGTIITSPNGTTWTLRTSGVTSALYVVRWNTRDQCFYAAGDAGVILRSVDGITWENIANDAIGAVIRNGSIQSNPQLQNLVVGIPNKVAMRIKENDFAVSVNGNDAVSDTSALNPVASRLSLGMSGTATLPFNGWIRKLDYFPFAKSNAELKQLST